MARLPLLECALVDPDKLRNYLLSPSHNRGRFKAAAFSLMGYSQKNWRRLEADIRNMIAVTEATPLPPGAHGQKFIVTGKLAGPAGRPKRIRTIWIVRLDECVPRLLTAYPES